MATSEPTRIPDELMNLIDNHIKGFNTHDNELYKSVFSDTAIVIDGIAPYRWLNPNAPANWLVDVEAWHEKFGVTSENLTYQLGVWAVEGTSAYAVILGTLTVGLNGQTMTREGLMTYTFTNYDGVWKVDSQAWGRTT